MNRPGQSAAHPATPPTASRPPAKPPPTIEPLRPKTCAKYHPAAPPARMLEGSRTLSLAGSILISPLWSRPEVARQPERRVCRDGALPVQGRRDAVHRHVERLGQRVGRWPKTDAPAVAANRRLGLSDAEADNPNCPVPAWSRPRRRARLQALPQRRRPAGGLPRGCVGARREPRVPRRRWAAGGLRRMVR